MDMSSLLVIRVCSLLLHIIGTYCLRTIYRREKHTNRGPCSNKDQIFLILNLSVSNIVIDALDLTRIQLLSVMNVYDAESIMRSDVETYQLMIRETISVCVYYFTLGAITINRFMKVKYNYNNKETIVVFIKTVWILALLMAVGLCLLHKYHTGFRRINFEITFYRYCYAPFDVAFIAVFVVCYGYILYRQLKSTAFSRRHQTQTTGDTNTNRPARNPRSYVPLFLGVSFLAFAVTPDFYIAFTSYLRSHPVKMFAYGITIPTQDYSPMERVFRGHKATLSYVCNILLRMNDSLIYIFIHPPVNKFFARLYRRLLCWGKDSNDGGQRNDVDLGRVSTIHNPNAV